MGRAKNFLSLHDFTKKFNKKFWTFKKDEITIGRKDADPAPTICLTGLGVQKFHAVIKKTEDGFKIAPGASNAKVKINGVPITSEVCLNNKDRVVLGSNHVYVFCGKFAVCKDGSAGNLIQKVKFIHFLKIIENCREFRKKL